MTFDELMKKFNGEWQGDNVVIQYSDGYYWIVAKKVDGKSVVTRDGSRLMGPSIPLANPSTSKVESVKRGKAAKPATPQDDLDLDDL